MFYLCLTFTVWSETFKCNKHQDRAKLFLSTLYKQIKWAWSQIWTLSWFFKHLFGTRASFASGTPGEHNTESNYKNIIYWGLQQVFYFHLDQLTCKVSWLFCMWLLLEYYYWVSLMKHQSSSIAHPPWWSHQWSTREWRGLSSSSGLSAGAAPETTHNKDGLVLNSSATLAAVLFYLTLRLQCVYVYVLVWMQHISGPSVSPGWSTDQHGKQLCCLVLVALLCQERLEEHQPQIISTNKAAS